MAYGAVSYLRLVNTGQEVHCSFVMGKSRLSPLKPMTIPRMEMSAAVLSTRLDRIIRKEIDFAINDSVFWTDSTCVLRYVANEEKNTRRSLLIESPPYANSHCRRNGGMSVRKPTRQTMLLEVFQLKPSLQVIAGTEARLSSGRTNKVGRPYPPLSAKRLKMKTSKKSRLPLQVSQICQAVTS